MAKGQFFKSKEMKESLNFIRAEISGVKDFDRETYNQEASKEEELFHNDKKLNSDYYSLLGHLLLGNNKELDKAFQEDPLLAASIENKAILCLNSLILDKEIKAKFFFAKTMDKYSQRRTSKNISKAIIDIVHSINLHLEDSGLQNAINSINFTELSKIVPDLLLYFLEYLCFYDFEAKSGTILEALINFQTEGFFGNAENCDNYYMANKHRLMALYYLKQKDPQAADKELLKFIKLKTQTDVPSPKPQITPLANKKGFPAQELLSNWQEVLGEIDEIQQFIFDNTFLAQNTCEFYECDDCCRYTFPTMSYTEYLYLKEWLTKNNYPLEKIIQKSETIQREHQNSFGSRLSILDKKKAENNIRGVENPHNFKYTCPFLEDGRCSCYEARPVLCRAFGLASNNKISIKTCNFHHNQYDAFSGPDNKKYTFDLRPIQSLVQSSDKYLNQQKKRSGSNP